MSNDYIKNADLETIFEMAKPFLEEAGRLTDKAEKLVELYRPQMKSVDEIIPLTDLFFSDFPELTEAEREVMAGETVPTVLEAFKAKLEAMTDDEFVTEIFSHKSKQSKKKQVLKEKSFQCLFVSQFQVKCMDQNYQIQFSCLDVKNQSSISKIC